MEHNTRQRNTRQRDAIRTVFARAGRPLSPIEVHEQADMIAPGLSIATVYRSLKSMVAESMLVTVDLPGQPPRYELSGLDHHHHFQCRLCGRVFDIDGCPGAIEGLAPPGFVVEDHEITLTGLCDACTSGS